MNIAVVGGGDRCLRLMELLDNHRFNEVSARVVAVADICEDAPGYVMAQEQGVFVSCDYRDLFDRPEIDIIMVLVNDPDLFEDVLKKKSRRVRAINRDTSLMIWELSVAAGRQRETRRKLDKTQALYEAVINELIHEDVMIIGVDYRVRDINDTMLEKIGLTRDAAIGRFCYELSHHQQVPCSGEDHPCPLIDMLESRRATKTTHIHLDKDNNQRHYAISCYPLIEDDVVTGAIEISRDITQDITLQKLMMQQEKMASIGRLSAGVAHEINNPLTTILTTALLIQEDVEADDPLFEDLDTIARETLRCRKIVTSLLDFARQNRPEKREIKLNDLVRESILLTKKQAAFKDIEVDYRISGELPRVHLDTGRMQQALINLILNAVEATEPGGRITVQTAPSDGGGVDIRVSDTGMGIPEDQVDKIFDPFFTTKEMGTGLGLAITHGIIDQHGGTIEVTSRVGEGTTFLIHLPAEAVVAG